MPAPALNPVEVGDGYLLDNGWTIAIPGWLRTDFRIDVPTDEKYIGDGLPGFGSILPTEFTAYPAFDLEDPDAVLRVRLAQMGPNEVVPRSQ
jgi:hypothetical protein